MPDDNIDKAKAWLTVASTFDGSNPMKAIPWELVDDHRKAQMIQDREALWCSATPNSIHEKHGELLFVTVKGAHYYNPPQVAMHMSSCLELTSTRNTTQRDKSSQKILKLSIHY